MRYTVHKKAYCMWLYTKGHTICPEWNVLALLINRGARHSRHLMWWGCHTIIINLNKPKIIYDIWRFPKMGILTNRPKIHNLNQSWQHWVLNKHHLW
jgi:hypothetical protein